MKIKKFVINSELVYTMIKFLQLSLNLVYKKKKIFFWFRTQLRITC